MNQRLKEFIETSLDSERKSSKLYRHKWDREIRSCLVTTCDNLRVEGRFGFCNDCSKVPKSDRDFSEVEDD